MISVAQKTSIVIGGVAAVSGLSSAIYLSTWTTIEQQISKEGLKLISNEEDYKFVLFIHKDSSELKVAINKDSLDFQAQGFEVKKWCEKSLKEWAPNDTLLKQVKAWCIVPKIKTLKDKLTGKLHKENAWQSKFTTFASNPDKDNKLLAALNESRSKNPLAKESKDGGTELSKWCDSALEQKIYEVDTKHKTEKNIEDWCFEK
ncbi:hypothetical protein A6V39_03235 [Candidatus Mycoplasma haematobovis]|uniref:Uncharacterized protein n=1 Tax=Candidatus Mycoplasma haematobovis TaxID=432608 RepID=A0A1A9QCD6_9MOLU|nr:hypothetical protein [Candidatus Mycoplasma haematobovis]OAL09898.1 hypothetical protein A6V39_03235 [Candidatus Mycoplasma haematobovis]